MSIDIGSWCGSQAAKEPLYQILSVVIPEPTSASRRALVAWQVLSLLSTASPDWPTEKALRALADQSQGATSVDWLGTLEMVEPTRTPAASGREQKIAANQRAVQLIEKWLADDSGYDVRVWPTVRRSLERNRLSYRKRFDD